MPTIDFEARNAKSQPLNGVIRVPSDDGSRTIGIIRDGVFLKSNWRSSKHLCRKYQAIGIDKGAFWNYVEPLATAFIVSDQDTGKEYRVSIEDFKQLGLEDDLGWGPQLFCPLKHFQVTEPNGKKPVQLSFFGGFTDE